MVDGTHLRLKGKYPDAFNSAIAYMPNCWDRKTNGPVRKMLVDEMKTFKELDSIIFSSPVDGGEDWNRELPRFKMDRRYTGRHYD